jgi:hypothetical protein
MEKKFLIFSKRARKNLRILAYVDKIGMVYFSVSPHPCGGGFEKQGSEPGAKATGGFSFGHRVKPFGEVYPPQLARHRRGGDGFCAASRRSLLAKFTRRSLLAIGEAGRIPLCPFNFLTL